ncbi:MAG: TolC family protein [Alphaproteobacteria bacterium]|uniref:TolC family protein n=1 Tax=Candidatus Nitrobium versatile TaxID=2884831 RepID=A0A953J9H1_9BACT|nr:TolC family protein [Candidatus Nitrobium versatile]
MFSLPRKGTHKAEYRTLPLFPLLFIALLGTVLSADAGVSRAAEVRMSLEEALHRALEENHELRAAWSSLSAQGEEIGIARSVLLPRLTFEERFTRTNNPPLVFSTKLNQERFSQDDFSLTSLNAPKAVTDFQTSLSFEQLLFAQTARIGLAMAKGEHSAESEDFLRKKEEVAFKVIQAYLMVHTAREYAQIAEKAVEDAREHLRIAELRYNAGLGLYSDTLRAATAVTDAEQRKVSAHKNLAVAKRTLGLLLGMPEEVDTSDEDREIPVRDLSYYTGASLSRKDIVSMQRRHEKAQLRVKLAGSAYLPTIGIGGGYQLNDHRKPFGAEGDSWHVGAFLRWDLFDGRKREHERAKAQFGVQESEEHMKALKNAVSLHVFTAYLGVKEARKNAELARDALKTAEEGTRLVRIRYENSLSPLVDLLDAQVSLDHARASLVARDNEYRTAAARLSYESGTLLKDLKIE